LLESVACHKAGHALGHLLPGEGLGTVSLMTEGAQTAGNTPTMERLRGLPHSERFDVLENIVTDEFKRTLLMTADEEFPKDVSFFEAGLTSLWLTEVKQRLEAVLGRPISASALFNQPTVERLMEHLTRDVLGDLFGLADAEPGTVAAQRPERARWDDVLSDLYQQ
jgi:hypothetical protein